MKVLLLYLITYCDLALSAVKPSTTRGMLIDAGSGGSRLHVYNWQRRVFTQLPPSITFPTSNERWTARIDPGVDHYGDDPERVHEHLSPLIDFAKLSLRGTTHSISHYTTLYHTISHYNTLYHTISH